MWSPGAIYLVLETSMGLAKKAMLAGKRVPGSWIHLSPPPQSWDSKCGPPCLAFIMWILGIKVRSLCLHGKHITN